MGEIKLHFCIQSEKVLYFKIINIYLTYACYFISSCCLIHRLEKHFVLFFVVFLLLGYSLTSEFYVPTFRNSLLHLLRSCSRHMKLEQTECSETLAQNSDAEEKPKRNNTTFSTLREFEIKNLHFFSPFASL